MRRQCLEWITQTVSLLLVMALLAGCSAEQKHDQPTRQQDSTRTYPVLIPSVRAAPYALPFCESGFCIDINIHDLDSTDHWFNARVDDLISDLIRAQLSRQLGRSLNQKLTLQQAVDAFIQAADDAANQQRGGAGRWSLQVNTQLAAQQQQLALVIIRLQARMGQDTVDQTSYRVLDRQDQRVLRLYDLIDPAQRLAFGGLLHERYAHWRAQLTAEQQVNLPDKFYWANWDWYFDEQGISVVLHPADWQLEAKDVVIELTPAQTRQMVSTTWLGVLGFSRT